LNKIRSGPSQTYPQRAYRNPLDRLVAYLDAKHGSGWAIWEFRAEGTGYPDEAVHHRIRHYPFPDHHPPPFRLVPLVLGSMRNWLRGGDVHHHHHHHHSEGNGDDDGEQQQQPCGGGGSGEEGDGKAKKDERVVVVHCKAGKGRSGTMACSYLIAECGWSAEDALARFTERRMRPNFGAGVSIPSQLRWVSYVDRWTKGGKKYVDRAVEIVEVHVWGLRNGVKVAIEGFAEEGKKIKVFHTFTTEERIVVEGEPPGGGGVVDMVQDMAGYGISAKVDDKGEVVEEADYETITGAKDDGNLVPAKEEGGLARSLSKRLKGSQTIGLIRKFPNRRQGSSQSLNKLGKDGGRARTIAMPEASQTSTLDGKEQTRPKSTTPPQNGVSSADRSEPGGQAVIFRPPSPVQIPNSDVNVSVERRSRAPGNLGLTMVTAVAHVWFNAFFEGNGPEQDGNPDDSGVFEMEWDKMDGIKGSSQKGTRAFDRMSVVWRVAKADVPATEAEASAIPGVTINEPREDSPVPQMQPADWTGATAEDATAEKHLGLRVEDPDSRNVSKASSVRSQEIGEAGVTDEVGEEASLQGVKVSGPGGEETLDESPARVT
jgi:hypothetical protein